MIGDFLYLYWRGTVLLVLDLTFTLMAFMFLTVFFRGVFLEVIFSHSNCAFKIKFI